MEETNDNYRVDKTLFKELDNLVCNPCISGADKTKTLVRHMSDGAIFALEHEDGWNRIRNEFLVGITARCCLSHLVQYSPKHNGDYQRALSDIEALFGININRESCEVDFSQHRCTREQRHQIADLFADAVMRVRLPDNLWVGLWKSDADLRCIMDVIKASADDYDLALRNLTEFKERNNVQS